MQIFLAMCTRKMNMYNVVAEILVLPYTIQKHQSINLKKNPWNLYILLKKKMVHVYENLFRIWPLYLQKTSL